MASSVQQDFEGVRQKDQSTQQETRNDYGNRRPDRSQRMNQGQRRVGSYETSETRADENVQQKGRRNRFPRKKNLKDDQDFDSSSQDESYRRRTNFNRRRGSGNQWNSAYRGFQGERPHGRQKQGRGSEVGEPDGQTNCGESQVEGSVAMTGEEKGSLSEPEPTRGPKHIQSFQNLPYDLNYHNDSGSDSGYRRYNRRYNGNTRSQRRSYDGNAPSSDHGQYSPSYSPTPYYSSESPLSFYSSYSPVPYQGYPGHPHGRYPSNSYQGQFSPTPYQGQHSPSPQGWYSPTTVDPSTDGLPPKGNSRFNERNGRRNTDSPRRQKKQQQHQQQQQQQHQQQQQQQQHNQSKPQRSSASPSRPKVIDESGVNKNQMSVLIEQLSNGSYECPVCYDHIRSDASVWSCRNCYTVFHLKCIRKWALSQAAAVEGSDGWMCPACRHDVQQIPFAYKCFCGKSRDPQFMPGEVPHSCGEVCRGKRPGDHCKHPCTILCHPGPCPPCPATVEISCLCERSKKTVRCSSVGEFQCEEVCGEILLCGQHYCEQICHKNNCKPCSILLQRACFCGQKTVSFTCGSDEVTIWGVDAGFSCDVPCQKQLSCGYHDCSKLCHHGECGVCLLTPEIISHCPCGKTPLTDLKGNDRDKCIDPIPTCEEICGKRLGCGGQDHPHTCQRICHEDICAPCNKTTLTKCACGHRYVDASCIDVMNSDKGYKLPSCDRKCTKRKHCGKHKCNRKCCTDLNHICDQICGRKLNCGVHFCEEFCHSGDCTRCLEASFEELTCHCGAQIMEPPIPCGATPPPCGYPCARYHPCDHPVRHTCHNDSQCPPCVELTSTYCYGKHEMRHNLPCHIKEISCGKPCSKPLACGAHTCQKTCHKGPCEDGGDCLQPCTVQRSDCGHPCNARCHVGLACPMVWTYCKAKVDLKCSCGNLSEMVVCMSGADESQIQRTSSSIAGKMHDLKTGEGVDISDMMHGRRKRLECNEMCAIIERNRRLAEALQIKDAELRPDVGAPLYSEFLKEIARKNPSVVTSVEKGLSNLVHSIKESKFVCRSHQFPIMNRDSRRMIHELAEFYGCQTLSYDQDPNRNVVATARKDKSYLPNMTLSAVVQRERFGKAPMPIPHHRKMDIRSPSPSTKLYSDPESSVPDKPKKIQPKEAEDYFDWTG